MSDSPQEQDEFRICGIIGLVLYGTLLVVVSYRLWQRLVANAFAWSRICGVCVCLVEMHRSDHKGRSRLPSRRTAFHIFLWLAIACELPMATQLVVKEDDEVYPAYLCYPFHLIAEALLFVSFSVVVTQWAEALHPPDNKTNYANIFFGLVSFIVCGTTVLAAGFCFASTDLGQFLSHEMYHTTTWVIAASMAVCSIGFFAYGFRLALTYSSLIRDQPKSKIPIIYVATFVCMICILLRCCMLVSVYFETAQNDSWISVTGWYVTAYWVPTIPPSYVLLFLTRKEPNSKPKPPQPSPTARLLDPSSSPAQVSYTGARGLDNTGSSSPFRSSVSQSTSTANGSRRGSARDQPNSTPNQKAAYYKSRSSAAASNRSTHSHVDVPDGSLARAAGGGGGIGVITGDMSASPDYHHLHSSAHALPVHAHMHAVEEVDERSLLVSQQYRAAQSASNAAGSLTASHLGVRTSPTSSNHHSPSSSFQRASMVPPSRSASSTPPPSAGASAQSTSTATSHSGRVSITNPPAEAPPPVPGHHRTRSHNLTPTYDDDDNLVIDQDNRAYRSPARSPRRVSTSASGRGQAAARHSHHFMKPVAAPQGSPPEDGQQELVVDYATFSGSDEDEVVADD